MKEMDRTTSEKSVVTEVDGHEIKLTFADEYNPKVAKLVRNALIDSFLKRHQASAT